MPIFQAQSAHYFDMQEDTPIFNQLRSQDAKMKNTLEYRNGTTNGNTIAHPMAHPMFAAPTPKPAGSIPELQKLSDEISASTSELSWYLSSTSHAQPSFERDTPISVLPKGAPEPVRIARQKLKQAALDLFRLASGPEEYISHVALNHHYTICLRWLCHFDIFAIVPTQGSISYSNIAILRSISESQLKTVCRMAMTNGLFCEPTEGRITHSATSALLATNNDFGAWATCVSDYMYSTGSKLAQAGEKWPRSQQITESAFNLAFETPMPFPEYLGRNPGFARNFGGFMKATQQIEANDLGHLVRGFNWASLGKTTVVDVGSTTAYPCIALARAFPDLKFISQPLPRTSADVKATIESLPQELANRITFAPHDMMMPQPENGAAVYLIQHVLHNMPLERAAKVMANIAPAIPAGGRIIIMDLVLPQIGEMETYREGMLRMRELIQRELSNGHTRDLNDWTAVCSKAGTGFKIVNAVMPAGSDLGLLEISV